MVKPEIIHIGPYNRGDSVESMDLWNEVQRERLGLGAKGLSPIWSDTDYTWFQNYLYYRIAPDGFFHLHPKFEDKAEVSILCRCGNITFKISIAHYEVVAICTQCGAREVIYSG